MYGLWLHLLPIQIKKSLRNTYNASEKTKIQLHTEKQKRTIIVNLYKFCQVYFFTVNVNCCVHNGVSELRVLYTQMHN